MRHVRASRRVRRRLRTRIDGYSSTFTVDVGAGGFCFQMNRPIAPGTELAGSFHLEGAEVPFMGRVAWITPGDPKLRIPSRMGVAFTRPPADVRMLVEVTGSPAA